MESIVGKPIEDVKKLNKQDILNMLGIDLGPVRLKCALLSLKVLKAGVYGLGDATLNGRELAVASYLTDHVLPLLEGRDARRIEDIWQFFYRGAYWRRGPVTMTAIAAVDVALWDILGKIHGATDAALRRMPTVPNHPLPELNTPLQPLHWAYPAPLQEVYLQHHAKERHLLLRKNRKTKTFLLCIIIKTCLCNFSRFRFHPQA